MIIEIVLAFPMRRWQQRLTDELRRDHQVSLSYGGPRRISPAVRVGLGVLKRLFGPRVSRFDTVPDAVIEPGHATSGRPDLVIALDGERVEADRVLVPTFDGSQGDAALLAMVAGGGTPDVRLQIRDRGKTATDIGFARLAIEDRDILSRALDQVLARLVTLILQAVRRVGAHDSPVASATSPHVRPAPVAPVSQMTQGLTRKIVRRIVGRARGPNHWRIGYRRALDGGDVGARAWSASAFAILPDDGARFYADPVPFAHQGRTYIFFEDFFYATGKGVIAVSEIGADGTASAPRTVLEQSWHLSYPHLLAHQGEIYMLPEMSGAGRVQLFRADPFPDLWRPDRVLLEGIVAADATPVQHAGLWWMFATLSDDGGSSWDQLCLFHAPDLFGPWRPHAGNPVLVDAGAARPAGAMWHEGGALMRVAQDCRAGYGVGLAICRVDRVDEAGFGQTVVARPGVPSGYEADGVHTLNHAGGLEVIDLRFSSASRWDVPCLRPAVHPSPAHG